MHIAITLSLLFLFYFLLLLFLLLFFLLHHLLFLGLFDEHFLHPFQFFKAERYFLEHLVPLVLLAAQLSGEGVVLLLHLLHALLVLVGDLHDLLDGDGLLGRPVLVVDAHHAGDLLLQLQRLLLVGLRQLGRLLADLREFLQLLRSDLLLLLRHRLVLRLHSNYYELSITHHHHNHIKKS